MATNQLTRRIMASLVAVLSVALITVVNGMVARAATSDGARADLLAHIKNVPASAIYGLADSTGTGMDTVKVVQAGPRDYLAVSHHLVGSQFSVRLATSTDLRTFTFRATLDGNASQPYIAAISDGSFVVADEKGDATGSHVRFLHYPSESALLSASADRTFDTSRTLSSCNEGTPDIESATPARLVVGFHYYSSCNVDREAQGTLVNFSSWQNVSAMSDEDTAIVNAGFPGKHGGRDLVYWEGSTFRLLEGQNDANLSGYANWRLVLFDPSTGAAYPAPVTTAHGSTAFANPKLTLLNDPSGNRVLLVTTFIFSEGAAGGEAGELLYAVPAPAGFDNAGVSSDTAQAAASFDGVGYSYSASALSAAGINPGAGITVGGLAYTWPNVGPGQLDNYQANGQVVSVGGSPNAARIGFLGAATNANPGAQGTAVVDFTDGTSQSIGIGLSDWTLGAGTFPPAFGNATAATMTYRNSVSGTSQTVTTYVFAATATLSSGKTVAGVTLPRAVDQGQLHVFAIATG
jgi:hypothetical protein